MRNTIIVAAAVAVFGSAAMAAEDTSRTYPKASCTERNANPDNCVIQDGPPRRHAFGNQAPPPQPAPKPAASGGPAVTILGGPSTGGSQGGR